jgi:diguanylate cyclase (GGDEF)-like protein
LSTWEESTTWIAVGASALAVALLVVSLVLLARLRRLRRIAAEADKTRGSSAVADLTSALERAREDAARAQVESQRAQEEGERARSELRWLHQLGEIGATIDLEDVLQRALEAATRLANAAAGLIVLKREDEEPLIATLGLSPEESARELLTTPPEAGHARAVTLTYRYTEEEVDHDEFRLRSGLAVPLADERRQRVGTLAIFWRRAEHVVADEELVRLEALTAALAPALENASRFEELRRFADLDPLTGLHSRRFLHEALWRECARARRYGRRLSLMLLRLDAPVTKALLAEVGTRFGSAVRDADLVCHLEDGRFAVLLPEAALGDAERAYRRLQFAAGSNPGGDGRMRVTAGIVELRPEDEPLSFLQRAESALAREDEDTPAADAAAEPGG